jgi:hypothetical protein
MNRNTGTITTQFHIIFDNQFPTAASIKRERDPPNHWEEVCLEILVHIVADDQPTYLSNDWLIHKY